MRVLASQRVLNLTILYSMLYISNCIQSDSLCNPHKHAVVDFLRFEKIRRQSEDDQQIRI